MKKVFKVLLKVLSTILCVPLCLVGAVCMLPLILIMLWIDLPSVVIQDIWDEEINKDE